MFRATTPVLHFELCDKDASINDFDKVFITLAQNNKSLLEKTKDDIKIIDDKNFELSLTQEETLRFQAQFLMQIQLRCLDKEGRVVASEIVSMKVEDALNEVIINGENKSEVQ